MEPILSDLVGRLQKALDGRLVSVILYGSAALPDGKDKYSDYNVLCVLQQVTPEELAAAEPVFRWWREKQNPSPLLLSEREVQTSTDCFPIEFHDIKERRNVLFGPDVVDGLHIDYRYYRAQVEYQLRTKLLRLRQKAGSVLSDREMLMRLMLDSVSTFCVLFRHALMLKGETAKFDKRAVVIAAQDRFGIDAGPFLTLMDVRDEKTKPQDLQAAPLFREYLKQVEALVGAVDAMEE